MIGTKGGYFERQKFHGAPGANRLRNKKIRQPDGLNGKPSSQLIDDPLPVITVADSDLTGGLSTVPREVRSSSDEQRNVTRLVKLSMARH